MPIFVQKNITLPLLRTKKNVFLAAVLVFMLLCSMSAYTQNSVDKVRLSNQVSNSRLVLELSDAVEHKIFPLSAPNRLVIDLYNTDLLSDLQSIQNNLQADKLITSVRSGKHGSNQETLRLVLDLNDKVDFNKFLLQSTPVTTHRLVVDLKAASPRVKPAPIAIVKPAIKPVPKPAPKPVVKPVIKPQPNKPLTKLPALLEPKKPVLVKPNSTSTPYSKPAPPKKPNLVNGKPLRDVIVAIDAGHGGKDPGAIGFSGTVEKVVVLQISKILAKKINAEDGMKAVLIRNGDYFIPLRGRIKKARDLKADLFLSIHADAFHKKTANGSSVFALSLDGATSEAAAWLANDQNKQLMGGVSLDHPDEIVRSVLFDLSQQATIKSSIVVGGFILESMGGFNRLHKSNVEQAPFAVLKSPDIPSVLIETAFITNPAEEKKLNNPKHQVKIAEAVTSGVKQYFARYAPPGSYLSYIYNPDLYQTQLSAK